MCVLNECSLSPGDIHSSSACVLLEEAWCALGFLFCLEKGTLQPALVTVAWHPLAGAPPAHAFLLVQLCLSSLARLMLSSLFTELVSDSRAL